MTRKTDRPDRVHIDDLKIGDTIVVGRTKSVSRGYERNITLELGDVFLVEDILYKKKLCENHAGRGGSSHWERKPEHGIAKVKLLNLNREKHYFTQHEIDVFRFYRP